MGRPVASSSAKKKVPAPRRPTVGIALGGGGARGLAHILMLEVLDELHLRPKVIAGTSIGALFGAAYASGISASQIRAHVEATLGQRFELLRDLFSARATSLPRLWGVLSARQAVLDPHALLEVVLPSRFAHDFASLDIPLKIVATDFYAQEQMIFTSGPLRPAVAASIALPVIFQPVMHEGRALIDGGLVNPLPFDLLAGEVDLVIAVDVTGAPTPGMNRDHPTATEALFASSFIFERTIVREKLLSRQPDIYVDAGMSRFQVVDFLKFRDILAAAEPAKQRLKTQLQRVLGTETLEVLEPPIVVEPPPPRRKPRRRLLGRRSRP